MNRFAFIDGLRGVAILAVIFHHSFANLFNWGIGTSYTGIRADIASSGFLGVNLFFVLSGFVLYRPYLLGARRIDEPGGVALFFKRRFHRLFPLYLFISALSLLFVLGHPGSRPFLIWAFLHVTVLFPFHPKTFLPAANWVMWSLGIEIWFSALFPVLVWLAIRYSIGRVLAVTVCAAMIARAIGYADLIPALNSGSTYYLSNSVIGRIDDFVFGMLAVSLIANQRDSRVTGRLARLLIGAVLVVAVCHLWGKWYRHEIPTVSAALFNLLLNIGFVLIIREVAGWRAIQMVFNNWCLRLFGMMCYSIYLWHGLVLIQFEDGVQSPAAFVAYFSTVLVLSWFTYRYIEFGGVRSYRELLPRPRERF